MNTTHSEEEKNIEAAVSYYGAMRESDFEKMAKHLGDEVRLISPLAQIEGKEGVVKAAKNFGSLLEDIEIRSRFGSKNQVMLAYDMVVAQPIGRFRAAALMDFKDGKIVRIELFYDAAPFEVKRDEIFNR